MGLYDKFACFSFVSMRLFVCVCLYVICLYASVCMLCMEAPWLGGVRTLHQDISIHTHIYIQQSKSGGVKL